MEKIGVAVQLYSVRKDCEKDFPGTLKAVAEMGYEGVEFAGYYNKSANELRKMLDDLGLKVAGTHIGLNTVLGDELSKTIEFNRILGNKYLIVPGLPKERTETRNAWIETAKLFNEIAPKVEKEGMLIGYHNHTIEFQPMEGELPWDTFGKNTIQNVIMQFDTGNAMHGGVKSDEVLGIVKRYPGRAITCHLKEFSSTNKAAILGEGEMKWKEFFSFCESEGGTVWYIIEQESYAFPPIECIKRCLENFKKIHK